MYFYCLKYQDSLFLETVLNADFDFETKIGLAIIK